MSFPTVEIDFPDIEVNPESPDSVREAISALSHFEIRRLFLSIRTETAAYTMNPADDRIVLVDASGGAVTITLPLAANADAVEYIVKAIDVTGGSVTVDGNGTETIDGGLTFVLANQFDHVRVASDGTAWHIVGRHP